MILGEFLLWALQPVGWFWEAFSGFFQQGPTYQTLFWFVVVVIDLGTVLLLYRVFGKQGLYGAIVLNIMLCNIMGPKLTHVFTFNTTMGAILYSGIYFATDLLSERYGRREASRAVWLGFSTSLMVIVLTHIGLVFEPTQYGSEEAQALSATTHAAQEALFGITPIIVMGSLCAYLASQLNDVYLFHWLKRRTQGRHLWLRNNVSTLTSQAIDTVIFASIGWTGLISFSEALQIGLTKYFFKATIAAIDTPFIYWARTWDVHDKDWHYVAQDAPDKHLVALRHTPDAERQ